MTKEKMFFLCRIGKMFGGMVGGKGTDKPSQSSELRFSFSEEREPQESAERTSGSDVGLAAVEFGDFQTPFATAVDACQLLKRSGVSPATVIEPTCGKGSFLSASCRVFQGLKQGFGFDINPAYVNQARTAVSDVLAPIRIEERNFFEVNWPEFVKGLPQPVLFAGNPPWVTNSVLGQMASENLPEKRNDSGLRGLDALTGKSNFDISEWMMSRMLDSIQGTNGTVAMLCKTSVARKIVTYAHRNNRHFGDAHLYVIDSKGIFGVSVDACLFRFGADTGMSDFSCAVYGSMDSDIPMYRFGFVDQKRVSNVNAYQQARKLEGVCSIKWRSGIKHDCSNVMELRSSGGALTNGLGEVVQVEPDFLYPLLKSSDLSKAPVPVEKRMIVVTQKHVGEDTAQIRAHAPNLWRYLCRHEAALRGRKSSIYHAKPPFSIFGVGPYSFAPWKIAISGLYKQSKFTLLGPHAGKPVMLDDTCYFLPFEDENKARICHTFLNSNAVQEFLAAVVFWDAKRPISAELLQRISLDEVLGVHDAERKAIGTESKKDCAQLNLWA